MSASPRPLHGSTGRTSWMVPNKQKRTIYHVRRNNKVSFLHIGGERFYGDYLIKVFQNFTIRQFFKHGLKELVNIYGNTGQEMSSSPGCRDMTRRS